MNPYFFFKNKTEMEYVVDPLELNRIYEHFLYKKLKPDGLMEVGHQDDDAAGGGEMDRNELKLCRFDP